jgi:hypothetical protein
LRIILLSESRREIALPKARACVLLAQISSLRESHIVAGRSAYVDDLAHNGKKEG